MTTTVLTAGKARLWVDGPDAPRARLALGHGAGGGVQARDLEALAEALPSSGISVVRVEQPWRVAGRRIAPRPPVLDTEWLAALAELDHDVPLVVGGRSAGARVACRTARELRAVGVVALAFPLHPPGRPERSRLPELTGAAVPTLVVQGERDTFGRPAEFPAGSATKLVTIPYADHGMAVPKAQDHNAALGAVVAAVDDFIGSLLA